MLHHAFLWNHGPGQGPPSEILPVRNPEGLIPIENEVLVAPFSEEEIRSEVFDMKTSKSGKQIDRSVPNGFHSEPIYIGRTCNIT
jgi:hypothetical protein